MKSIRPAARSPLERWFGAGELRLNEAAAVPLYHQLYMLLRSRILNGVIGQGERLPTEQEFADVFGISRITAKRAMQGLVADGMIERRRGRGSYVTYRRPSGVDVSVTGLLENLVSLCHDMPVSVLRIEQVPPPALLRGHADAERSARVCMVERTRSHADGRPFAWYMSWTPGEAARAHFTETRLGAQARLEILFEHGVVIDHAEQDLFAAGASDMAANALDVMPGDPVLRVERRCYGPDGACVDLLHAEYHPMWFRYRMTLYPQRQSATAAAAARDSR